MIFYTDEFAAHILQFYRFQEHDIQRYVSEHAPLIIRIDNCVVNFNTGELDWDNWHNVRSAGRTLYQLAYDAAMTWQGVDWYTWLKHPSYIPQYERPDIIEYMSDTNFELAQSRQIQQALCTGRAWTEYLTQPNIKDYLLCRV